MVRVWRNECFGGEEDKKSEESGGMGFLVEKMEKSREFGDPPF